MHIPVSQRLLARRTTSATLRGPTKVRQTRLFTSRPSSQREVAKSSTSTSLAEHRLHISSSSGYKSNEHDGSFSRGSGFEEGSQNSQSDLSSNWLAEAIPKIVKRLSHREQGKACQPLLELVHSDGEQLVLQSRDLGLQATEPYAWKDWVLGDSEKGADGIIFIRPIENPYTCPINPGSSDSATSDVKHSSQCSNCSLPTQAAAPSNAVEAFHPEMTELEGELDVDGCCSHMERGQHQDPAASSHQHSDKAREEGIPGTRSRRRFRVRAQNIVEHLKHSKNAGCQPEVSYYGLVAQCTKVGLKKPGGSVRSTHCDGCYVLKTSKNKDVSGCTCTMYALTRLCYGMPLEQQLHDNWLAN